MTLNKKTFFMRRQTLSFDIWADRCQNNRLLYKLRTWEKLHKFNIVMAFNLSLALVKATDWNFSSFSVLTVTYALIIIMIINFTHLMTLWFRSPSSLLLLPFDTKNFCCFLCFGFKWKNEWDKNWRTQLSSNN